MRVSWLPGGDAGIFATLAAMRHQARQAAAHPLVQQVARDAVSGAADPVTAWRGIRRWVADRTRFQFDPPIETLYTPLDQLGRIARTGRAAGDCDDVAMLAASLGIAAGLRARFVVTGYGAPGPAAHYQHVYTDLWTPQGWRDVDVTRRLQSPYPTRHAAVEV